MKAIYYTLFAAVFLLAAPALHAQFGTDVKMLNQPGHDEERVSIDVAFNGWVYAAFTFDSGLVIRMSKDNGDTWQTIDSGAFAGTVYPYVKLVVAGTDTNNIRLFELSDAFVTSTGANELYINKYDGRTGGYMTSTVLANFSEGAQVRGIDLATDYKFPSISSSPYSVAVIYGEPAYYDSLFMLVSTDSGNTYNRQLVTAIPGFLRNMSLAYGVSANFFDGRYFMAWEQFSSAADLYGNIYTSYTPSAITDIPSAPVNLDSLYPTTVYQLRDPKISCSMSGSTDNDSGNITALIAVERHATGLSDENILGFKNMNAVYGNTWTGFDIVNTLNLTQHPDLSFDPAFSNFLLTYFDSTAMQLPYLVNNYNLTSTTWGVISQNYADDTTILFNPLPTVRINPAFTKIAVGWTGGPTGSGVSLFDAEYRKPLPLLTLLSPDTVIPGNTAFTLTLTGDKFVNTSWVMFGSDSLATTFVNGGQLTASVPATAVASSGTMQVIVMTPTTTGGGGTSNSLPFYVLWPAGINNVVDIYEIKVYPNPSSGVLNISFSLAGEEKMQVSLLDMTGRRIKQLAETTFSGNGTMSLDVSDVAAGIYQVMFQTDNSRTVQKISIVR